MFIYARQGDLVFDKLPDNSIVGELKKATNLVLAGQDSTPHTVNGTVLSRQEGVTTLLRLVERMEVQHGVPGRHNKISLEPGDYKVYPLRERGDKSDRSVED